MLDEDGKAALQYGTTEGDLKLSTLLAERHRKDGLNLSPEQYHHHHRLTAGT